MTSTLRSGIGEEQDFRYLESDMGQLRRNLAVHCSHLKPIVLHGLLNINSISSKNVKEFSLPNKISGLSAYKTLATKRIPPCRTIP